MHRFVPAVVFFVALPAVAADPAVPQAVTLERIVEIARRTAPAIAAARARVDLSRERGRATTLFPDLGVTAGAGRGEPEGGAPSGSETSLELSAFLPAPWGAGDRRRSATAAVEAAGQEAAAVEREVVFEATTRYYAAALGAARAAAFEEAAVDARSLSEIVARQVEVGEKAGVDLLRTRVETLRARSEWVAASGEADGAKASLNRFLLGALGADFTFPKDIELLGRPSRPVAGIEDAVSVHPALRAAALRVDAARSAADAQRAARIPGIEVTAFRQDEIDKTATGLALGVALPLWNRNRSGVGIARAELTEAEAQARGLRANLEAALEQLVARDRAAQENAVTYRTEIVPASREALAAVRISLEQGEADLLAWLEARRSYLEILRASYEAQFAAFVTRAELERLIGDSHATR